MRPSLARLFTFLLMTSGPLAAQSSIALTSGVGTPGGSDPTITYLLGPASAPFAAPFTSTDFQMAQAGPPAVISPTLAGGWVWPLPQDGRANWIQPLPGDGSALYAIPFQVTTTFRGASLTLWFATDDHVGWDNVTGVYVNEQPLAGAERIGTWGHAVEWRSLDVGPHLQPGANTLYVYQVNTGGRGGLIFGARIDLDRATWTAYGSGCSGSVGAPQLAVTNGLPQPGLTVDLELRNLPQVSGSVLFLLGISKQSWNGIPLPFDLATIGMGTNCRLWTGVETTLQVSNASGSAILTLPIPALTALIGLQSYAQALVPDPGVSSAIPATMSNAVQLMMGY